GVSSRNTLRSHRLRGHRNRLRPNPQWRDRGRDQDARGGRGPSKGRGRGGGAHRLLLCEDLLLLLQEPLPLFGDFCPANRNRFLFSGKPLLALHELAVSVNLRLEGCLLFLEELDEIGRASCREWVWLAR